jgi:hypothetical protein
LLGPADLLDQLARVRIRIDLIPTAQVPIPVQLHIPLEETFAGLETSARPPDHVEILRDEGILSREVGVVADAG